MRFDRRIYLLILTGAGTFTTKKKVEAVNQFFLVCAIPIE